MRGGIRNDLGRRGGLPPAAMLCPNVLSGTGVLSGAGVHHELLRSGVCSRVRDRGHLRLLR